MADSVPEKDIKQEIATVARDITMPAYAGVLRHLDDTLLTRGGGSGLKIYDDIERDCKAYGDLQKRKLAIISRPWQVDPASTSRIDKKAADMVRAQFAAIEFDQICLNLLDALLKGFTVGEAMWEAIGNEIVCTAVKARDQRRFGFGDDYRLRLKTFDNLLPGMELPERKFIVHSFGAKDGNPYGLGLGTRLFWPVYFKRQGITFWLTFADKFGSPTAVGKYPPGAQLAEQNKLLAALGAIAQDSGVIVPEGMIIELLEATRGGATDTYEKLARYMDEEITFAVLGESPMSRGSGGAAASAAITRNEVRLELVQADSDLLSSTINKSLATWITELNLPGATPPRVWRKVEEQKDLGAVATRDKTIFGMGFRPTLAYIQETYGGEWTDNGRPPVVAAQPGVAFAEGAAAPMTSRLDAATTPAWNAVLDHIQTLVENADSLDALQTALTDAYGGLPLDDLRTIMETAFAVAQLAGMVHVESGN
jgi:phage gp29-like protein